MTAATGAGNYPVTLLTRRMPSPGEIGHLGSCPLCVNSAGAPPCLACRDELRARLFASGSMFN